jgi:hypothetical protein
MQRLWGWAGTSLLIFLAAGYLFASDATRWWAEAFWLAWIGGVLLLSLGSGAIYATMLVQAKRHRPIFPDDNGNLPLFKERGQWVNGNLVGVDHHPQAWAIWQATNNRSLGSPARELFRPLDEPLRLGPGEPGLPRVSRRGQSQVIDAVAEEL